MISALGELAALAGAAAFSVTSVCYTFAGRKVDSVTSIALSLPIAWVMVAAIHRAALGAFLPTGATAGRWLVLSASGILAFVVSSYFMLNAYQRIGPRLSTLIAAFTPVLGALLAWLFLGESLPPRAALGIGVTISGIVWVVAERGRGGGSGGPGGSPEDKRRGVIDAALGTLAQAAAFAFASAGVSGGFAPLSATSIRLLAAIAVLWALLAVRGRAVATAAAGRDRALLLLLTGAALSGPVIAASLVLLALQHIPLGVATTLSHTTAVMLIPVGHFVFGERITPRAVAGTLVAVAGVAILFV